MPIPISPVAQISAPFSFTMQAVSIPLSIDSTASAAVIAGPLFILNVPFLTLQFIKLEDCVTAIASSSAFIPASATITCAPAESAIVLIAAPPLRKFLTIWTVTSCLKRLTPSSTTPWSPAKTHTNLLFEPLLDRGLSFSVIATTSFANSSSLPKLPLGFISLLSLFSAIL